MPKPSPYLQALGKRIASLRKAARISQEQLAETAGLSVEMVSKIERGMVNPSILILRSVAAGLAVDVTRLIAEPGTLEKEIVAMLAGRNKAEQARILMVLKAMVLPLEV